jgi:hypothetical protein
MVGANAVDTTLYGAVELEGADRPPAVDAVLENRVVATVAVLVAVAKVV